MGIVVVVVGRGDRKLRQEREETDCKGLPAAAASYFSGGRQPTVGHGGGQRGERGA